MTSARKTFGGLVLGSLALLSVGASAQQPATSPHQPAVDRITADLKTLTERLSGLAAPKGDKLSPIAAQECDPVTRYYAEGKRVHAVAEMDTLLKGTPAPALGPVEAALKEFKAIAQEKCVPVAAPATAPKP